jgi:hypothetical protein
VTAQGQLLVLLQAQQLQRKRQLEQQALQALQLAVVQLSGQQQVMGLQSQSQRVTKSWQTLKTQLPLLVLPSLLPVLFR